MSFGRSHGFRLTEHFLYRQPPSAIAVQDTARGYTFDALSRETERFAKQITESCGSAEAVFLIVLPNSVELLLSFFATSHAGGIPAIVQGNLSPSRLEKVAVSSGAKYLICANSRSIVEKPFPGAKLKFAIDFGTPGIEQLAVFSLTDAGRPLFSASISYLMFTSGSTGSPKAVPMSHDALLRSSECLLDFLSLRDGHREMVINPMGHISGSLIGLSVLRSGKTLFLRTGFLTQHHFLEEVAEHGISGAFISPFLLEAVTQSFKDFPRKDEVLSNLRYIHVGSALAMRKVVESFLEKFPTVRLLTSYGMTESPCISFLDCRASPQKLHTVGKPNSGVRIAIVGASSPELPGEIQISSPYTISAYWNNERLDTQKFSENGLKTGDLGWIDNDGYLVFSGRGDDLINYYGHHFFPSEIEVELTDVLTSGTYAALGVPDKKNPLMKFPVLFIQASPLSRALVLDRVRMALASLPPHMRPHDIVFLERLPKTPTGKLDRETLLGDYIK